MGQEVYDHNNPYNEKGAMAPIRKRGKQGMITGVPKTIEHSEIGMARVPLSDQSSLSQSFQKKMNIQQVLDKAKTARQSDELGENFKNMSPPRVASGRFSEDSSNSSRNYLNQNRNSHPQRLHPIATSAPMGSPKELKRSIGLTASDRVRLREAQSKSEADLQSRKSKAHHLQPLSLTSGLDEMSAEELDHLSTGMEELKRMAQEAERKSRLEQLKEELALLEQGSPIHRTSHTIKNNTYSDSNTYVSPPASPRRQDRVDRAPHRSLALSPTKGILKHKNTSHKENDEGNYNKFGTKSRDMEPYGENNLRDDQSRTLSLPPLKNDRQFSDSDNIDYRHYHEQNKSDPYMSPRTRKDNKDRTVRPSPENRAAIQALRSAGGKFFQNDFENVFTTQAQSTYRKPSESIGANRSQNDGMVFGIRTARDKVPAIEGIPDEQLSPSQRLRQSCPFATQPELAEITVKRTGLATSDRPSHPYPYPGGTTSVDKYSRDTTNSTGGALSTENERFDQQSSIFNKQNVRMNTNSLGVDGKRSTRPW